MFLLIPALRGRRQLLQIHLHSTMFLLIREITLTHPKSESRFTFHYVSTYTGIIIAGILTDKTFTFHYVSTYTMMKQKQHLKLRYLHSTMFLLILVPSQQVPLSLPYLHSTMFLLIHYSRFKWRKYFPIYIPLCFYLYLSQMWERRSEILIYIPLCFYLYNVNKFHRYKVYKFTFHYVSTYTGKKRIIASQELNLHSTMFLLILLLFQMFEEYLLYLHSTMFLLILSLHPSNVCFMLIYIPLCFYLYPFIFLP